MVALDPTAAFLEFRGIDSRDAKGLNADASADDIGNRIEGAYFMEVNFFGSRAVDFCFGYGDTVEDRKSVIFDERREFAGGNEISDVGVAPFRGVDVVMAVIMSRVVSVGM